MTNKICFRPISEKRLFNIIEINSTRKPISAQVRIAWLGDFLFINFRRLNIL
jgi:hypothetical protein